MNTCGKKICVLFTLLVLVNSTTLSFAQESAFDLEDIALSTSASFITEEKKKICALSEIKNVIYLPFRLTIKYPHNTDVNILATSNNPEESKLKRIQDATFFTLSSEDSTDVFTILADWEYQSNPIDGRTMTYEIFSQDRLFESGYWHIDDFLYCKIWVIGTQEAPHVPTLEEFKEENRIEINEITETLVGAIVDNNDIILLLILGLVIFIIAVLVMIGLALYSMRESDARAVEAEDRLVTATQKVSDMTAGLRILARNDNSQNEMSRKYFIQSCEIGFTSFRNCMIDVHKLINEIVNLPNIKDGIRLKSRALRTPVELKILKQLKGRIESGVRPESDSTLDKVSDYTKSLIGLKKSKKDKNDTSTEFYLEKYQDVTKYPNSKLETIELALRKQYEKKSTDKLVNEINAIVLTIKIRMDIK